MNLFRNTFFLVYLKSSYQGFVTVIINCTYSIRLDIVKWILLHLLSSTFLTPYVRNVQVSQRQAAPDPEQRPDPPEQVRLHQLRDSFVNWNKLKEQNDYTTDRVHPHLQRTVDAVPDEQLWRYCRYITRFVVHVHCHWNFELYLCGVRLHKTVHVQHDSEHALGKKDLPVFECFNSLVIFLFFCQLFQLFIFLFARRGPNTVSRRHPLYSRFQCISFSLKSWIDLSIFCDLFAPISMATIQKHSVLSQY